MPDSNIFSERDVDNRAVDQIVGFIEVVNESGIYGWAYRKDAPAEAATLLFYIDDEFICDIACTNYRSDVKKGGHLRAEVGFHVEIPREYFDSKTHTYHFSTSGGSNVCLNSIKDTPEIFRCFTFSNYFDLSFYTRFYPETKTMCRSDAFQHWETIGEAEGRFTNAETLLANLEKKGEILPDDFSANLYRFLSKGLTNQIELDWEAAAHYLKNKHSGAGSHLFSESRFVIDLYFGGIEPNAAQIQDIFKANGSKIYTSCRDILQQNGITSDRFLKYLNICDYVTDNPGCGLNTRLQCVRHFAETGLKALKPLSFEHFFDYEFVAELDRFYTMLAPESAYLLWVNEGIDAGLAPNHEVFLAELRITNTAQFPAGFDADIYLAKNPDLSAGVTSRWSALRHFVKQGLIENREGCPITTENCEIYRAVADGLAISEKFYEARKLYEAVLEQDPFNTIGMRHYADCLLRLDEPFQAARMYLQTIAQEKDNIWTHLNLAICYSKLKRWKMACNVVQSICIKHPENQALSNRLTEITQEAYSALAAEAHWLACNKFYGRAREEMRQACDILTAPFANLPPGPTLSKKPVRSVAIIGDFGLPQCKFYRIDQKAEQLKAAGIDCKLFNYHTDISKFSEILPWTDAVILYRVPGTPQVMNAIFMARKAGLPTFYEIDDLMFEETQFPDSFESYGGQISHDLYATLITGTIALKTAMSVCDYAIASTPALAKAMQNLVRSGQAFIHRNGLSATHELSYRVSSPRRDNDKIRIFYGSGTKAHNEDFETNLGRPLAKLLNKWGSQLELYIMGYLSLPAVLRPYQSQITIRAPNWDVRTYWRVLQEMDINLAVLNAGQIADCKSEIKWLEAAMLGVPSVVSATSTYREVIEQNKTGVLIRNQAEWFSKLDVLVGDASKRQAIAQAARKSVLKNYAVEALGANLIKIFQDVSVARPPPKIKILVAHVFFDPQLVGGATRVVSDNVRDLIAIHGDEVEIEIFTTLEGGAEAYVPSIYLSDTVKVTAITTPMLVEIDKMVWDERMGEYFIKVIDRFEPDIIHFHCIQRLTASVCEAARKKAIPYVITVHDGWWISDEQFLVDEYGVSKIYDYVNPLNELSSCDGGCLERMRVKQEYLSAAVKVIAVSEPFAAIYRQCGFNNVISIANGVSNFNILPRKPSPDGCVRLAHIGGAKNHKGYHLVRAALSSGKFPNLSLLVIDHAMEPKALRRAVWGETKITFRGKFSQGDVSELYSQVDVLLAPSVWPESYGLVTREAMLAGCWAVASDRGAIGADISPGNGFVVNVDTHEALSGVFSEMNENPAKFLQSPDLPFEPRRARAQAEDVFMLYKTLLQERTLA